MQSTKQNHHNIESLNALIEALNEEDESCFHDIIRSIQIPVSVFREHCFWSDDSYTRNCIAENDKFELILLCWEPGQETPIHDHGGEECWVKIIEGKLKETIYQLDDQDQLQAIKSSTSETGGITYMDDFMGYHKLENLSSNRSMSLHLYAKPIRACNAFDETKGTFVNKYLVYTTVSEIETGTI